MKLNSTSNEQLSLNASAFYSYKESFKDVPGEVLFGSPKTNCTGHGICRVNLYGANEVSIPRKGKCRSAFGRFSHPAPRLVLCSIPRKGLCTCLQQGYLDHLYLDLNDSFQMHWMATSCTPSIHIAAGRHFIARKEDQYDIYFRLRKKQTPNKLLPL